MKKKPNLKKTFKRLVLQYFNLPKYITYPINVALISVLTVLISQFESNNLNFKDLAIVASSALTSLIAHFLRLFKGKLEKELK
jgi:hypothetical protein